MAGFKRITWLGLQVISLLMMTCLGCTQSPHKTITAVERPTQPDQQQGPPKEIAIRMTGNDLFDNFLVDFKEALVQLPTIHLLSYGKDVLDSTYYQATFTDDTRKKVRFTFSHKIIRYENEHKGRTYTLEIAAYMYASRKDFAHRYATTYTFGGTNWFRVLGLPLILFLIVLNTVLIVLAIWNDQARKMLLTPTGWLRLPAFPAYYLFSTLILHRSKTIRLALFNNYRKQYQQLHGIARWQMNGVQYVPPVINNLHSEDAWQQVFNGIMQSPQPLHVLIGKPGLGKTLLLEQWTCLALDQRHTPILLRLGEEAAINEALACQMKHFGGLSFTPQQALDIVMAGGFVLLLDGFNESSEQEEVRQFIHQAAKNNKVIVASQYAPKLGNRWPETPVRLEPFGKEQLQYLFSQKYQLDDSYVDRLLGHSLLADMVALPHTADLMARYIVTRQQLPAFRMDIYQALRQKLDADLELLNLEYKAWQLFCNNSQSLQPDEYLPARFCEAATAAGILTKGHHGFRFSHERLHRYFVARYLQWQDERPLEAWHKELHPGLDRTYWADALGMWHELKIDGLLKGQLTMATYEDFVLSIAVFSAEIYATRIAGAIALFEEAGRLNMTNGYWAEIGRILSVQRKAHTTGW